MKILFMCVANSARSQLAEGLARARFGDSAWIESAGSEPKFVNPYAIRVMREVGVDISKHESKGFEELDSEFREGLDYIITLCAEEVCPAVASKTAKRLHWPFPDPAGHLGHESVQMARFRETRDLIKDKLDQFARSLGL